MEEAHSTQPFDVNTDPYMLASSSLVAHSRKLNPSSQVYMRGAELLSSLSLKNDKLPKELKTPSLSYNPFLFSKTVKKRCFHYFDAYFPLRYWKSFVVSENSPPVNVHCSQAVGNTLHP